MMKRYLFLSFVILAGSSLGPRFSFAQNPSLTVSPSHTTDLSIHWSADGSDPSNPVVRAYLHGPFNTVEGSTPSDPTNPDALCTNIAKVWYNQTRALTSADGTYCNPDDDGLCPVDPDVWFGDIPDDSTGPLAGMRAPHCQLNICGNTDPAVWPDQGACVDSRGNMVGDGGHEIKVENARTSGTYFLVFEKEDGTTDIFRKEYTLPAPDCGTITAEVNQTSPQADFTVNPQNATRVCVSGDGTVCRDVTGAGSVLIPYPLHGKQEYVTVSCEGAGPAQQKDFSIQLGELDLPGALSLEAGGCPPNDVCDLALTYRVHRISTVQPSDLLIGNFSFGTFNGSSSSKSGSKGIARSSFAHEINMRDMVQRVRGDVALRRKGEQNFKFAMAPHFVPWVKTISIQGIFSGPGNARTAPSVLMSPIRVRRADQASGTFTVPRSHFLHQYALVVCDFDDRCFTQTVDVPYTSTFTITSPAAGTNQECHMNRGEDGDGFYPTFQTACFNMTATDIASFDNVSCTDTATFRSPYYNPPSGGTILSELRSHFVGNYGVAGVSVGHVCITTSTHRFTCTGHYTDYQGVQHTIPSFGSDCSSCTNYRDANYWTVENPQVCGSVPTE